ncbi:transient receptor potential cation channel subfamily A member 1-like [Ptychodera flava]|uniref:transient receptor potential cation channel subfamily A member 1-like n=1 Tax=Ptychodera flava TaxID=63121 RepID=UPI00396A2168
MAKQHKISRNGLDTVIANPMAVELKGFDMKELRENGTRKQSSANVTDLEGSNNNAGRKRRSSSCRSSRRRQDSLLKSLLTGMEATVREEVEDDEESMTIWQAARLGRTDVIQNILLHQPFLLDKTDVNGASALHYAVRYNNEDSVEELLNQGAEPKTRIQEHLISPLHLAAKRNYTCVMKLLLRNGAEVSARDINGMVPLHVSAKKGNREATEVLLVSRDSDVNVKDYDMMTPLHQAAMQGNVELCKILVEHGADVRAKEINDITPIMFAAIRGNIETIKLLFEVGKEQNIEPEAFLEDIDDEGSNALHLAVAAGHLEVARLCLDLGADIESTKFTGFTSLHIASVYGNAEMATMLIERGANVNAKDGEHMTPLHRASMYSRMDVMHLLCKKGALLEARDLEFFTTLLAAAWKGQIKAAQFLIQQGADVTVCDRDMKTCLHWAVEGNHFDFIKMLLDKTGMQLLNRKDKNEQTAVHCAAEAGSAKILRLLLELKADVNWKDSEEQLPLHVAAHNGCLECVRLLVEATPTRINEDDIDGNTPLLLAAEKGHDKVVQHLLKVGADISSKDENRRTSLALAAKEGRTDTVKVLLKNHAEIDAVDKNRNTPLHLSAGKGHVEVTRLLLDNGANANILNDGGNSALDHATVNLEEDTAATIVTHKVWKEVVSQPSIDGYPPLKRLIERLPDVAAIVFDQCVQYSHEDKTNPKLKITYDFTHIDPGPDGEITKVLRKRWTAFSTMVQYGRGELLMHELCKTLLAYKWKKFARYFFAADFALYILFLMALMAYVFLSPHPLQAGVDTYGCPGSNNSFLYDENGRYIGPPEDDYLVSVEIFILLYCAGNILREILEIVKQRVQYFTEVSNLFDWGLYVTSTVFVLPPTREPCTIQWEFGALAAFCGWMNLIMYFRRFELFGIYIVMFFQIVKSFLKAVMVVILFVLAFSTSFSILLGNLEQFANPIGSFVKVCVMTIGEMDYTDIFYSDMNLAPFDGLATVLFMIFLCLMPIVLMNLMVGIAVGDIEFIQQNANVEKMEMQIDLIRGIERSLPKSLQRKWQVRKLVVEPYKTKPFSRLINRFSRWNAQARIAAKEEAKIRQQENDLDQLRKEVDEFNSRMTSSHKLLTTMMERQMDLVKKMAEKMDVTYDETEFMFREKYCN